MQQLLVQCFVLVTNKTSVSCDGLQWDSTQDTEVRSVLLRLHGLDFCDRKPDLVCQVSTKSRVILS